jgi:hypothetical protein
MNDEKGNRYFFVKNVFGIKTFKITSDYEVIYNPSLLERLIINIQKKCSK